MSMPHNEVEVRPKVPPQLARNIGQAGEKEVSYYVRNHCNRWKAV